MPKTVDFITSVNGVPCRLAAYQDIPGTRVYLSDDGLFTNYLQDRATGKILGAFWHTCSGYSARRTGQPQATRGLTRRQAQVYLAEVS